MIYKSQFKYFKLYKKNNIYYKIQDKGFKIKLNDYTFYVNKNFIITEESTGQKVQTPENFKPETLQDIEDYLNYIYVFNLFGGTFGTDLICRTTAIVIYI